QADPASLVRHLNEYFDRMVTAIGAHGGVIDKFIGDAVMAVFGGVIELESPAMSAMRAAQDMRLALADLNDKWAREGIPQLGNGIGMHYGAVLQGAIGSSDRKEFTVMGDTVNVAARLESVTKDHEFPVLVSSSLVDALPESLRALCIPVGPIKLKGRA